MFFDSHAHLNDEKFDADREAVIGSMPDAGVSFIANIGDDLASSRQSVVLAKRYPFIYAAVGVHPHNVAYMTENDIKELAELTEFEKTVAIGEIGLDYYYDNSPRELQKKWFKRQIELALELDKPIAVHCRDAVKDCTDILKKYNISKIGGVMHCFSGSTETAFEIIKLGMYISVGGTLTFKNNRKAVQVVSEIPLEHILIETDCPYLSPEPLRGTRNDSRNVKYVAEKIAEIKAVPVETVAKITEENAKNLYRIK